MKKNANKGFSLVELIIVIAIMAVLVGVLAPQFIKYVESSRQSTDIDTVASFKTAIESAVVDSAATTTAIESASISVAGGTTKTVSPSIDLSDIGLPAAGETSALKSSGWSDATYTYQLNTTTGSYEWNGAGTANTNSKKPGKDLTDAFK